MSVSCWVNCHASPPSGDITQICRAAGFPSPSFFSSFPSFFSPPPAGIIAFASRSVMNANHRPSGDHSGASLDFFPRVNWKLAPAATFTSQICRTYAFSFQSVSRTRYAINLPSGEIRAPPIVFKLRDSSSDGVCFVCAFKPTLQTQPSTTANDNRTGFLTQPPLNSTQLKITLRVHRGNNHDALLQNASLWLFVSSGHATLPLDQYIGRIRRAIPQVQPHSSIRQQAHGRRRRARRQVPAFRQHHGISRPPQAPVKHQVVHLEAITSHRRIRLRNPQPYRLPLFHGRKPDHDHLACRRYSFTRINLRHGQLFSRHDFGFEFLSGIQHVGRRIRNRAAASHHVYLLFDAGPRLRVIVIKTKRMTLWFLQKVNDVAILVRPLGKARLLRLAAERRFP